MHKSNAINVLTTIPTAATRNKNGDNKLEILPLNDKNIQCDLLSTPLYLELRGYSIEDQNKRKFLVRAMFGWIILQNIIHMPVMYLFQRKFSIFSLNIDISAITWIINLSISAILYRFQDLRRPMANAYLSLIFVTILTTILMGVYANIMNSLTVIFHPIILISQLSAILVYSLQSKFKLTNFLALIIVLAVYLVFLCLNIFIFNISTFYSTSMFSTLIAVYIIVDTQLILTSPLHKYHMSANEHVFGVVNLFADQSKLGWLIFRCFFLDSIILFCRNVFKTLTSKLY